MAKKLIMLVAVLAIVPVMALAFVPATLYKGKDLKAVTSQQASKSLFSKGYKLYKGQKLGAQVVTDFSVRLSASITSSQSTIPVTSMVTKDGHTLTMVDFGSTAYLTLESGGAREEIAKCTGISGSSFTGCTRGLAFYGTSTASVTANQYSHQSGSSVILSNVHYVYLGYMDLDSTQVVTGFKTFTINPYVPKPTVASGTANKEYVDGVAIAGAPDASLTVKGISKLSSNPSVATNPIALNSEEVGTTSGANKVVRASSTGTIDPSFINQAGTYNWTGTTTFSGTTTYTKNAATGTEVVNLYTAKTSTSSIVSGVIATSSTAGTTYGYSTTTTNFRPHAITIFYDAQGRQGSGLVVYCRGQISYNSASSTGGQWLQNNVAPGTYNPSVGVLYYCGDGGANARIEWYVDNVTDTSFTLRFTKDFGTTWTGSAGTFYAVATQ